MPHAQLHTFLWNSWNPQLYNQGHRNTKKRCFIYLSPQSITHVCGCFQPHPLLTQPLKLLLCSPTPSLLVVSATVWYTVCGLAASLEKLIKIIFEDRGSQEQHSSSYSSGTETAASTGTVRSPLWALRPTCSPLAGGFLPLNWVPCTGWNSCSWDRKGSIKHTQIVLAQPQCGWTKVTDPFTPHHTL